MLMVQKNKRKARRADPDADEDEAPRKSRKGGNLYVHPPLIRPFTPAHTPTGIAAWWTRDRR